MGFCPTPTPESFYIGSDLDPPGDRFNCTACGHNRIEIRLIDIPKIRAALDQVEAHVNGPPTPIGRS